QLGEDYVLEQLADKNSHQKIAVEAMPIDNRINIPDCPVPYTLSAASNSLQQSNITVKASCSSNDWFLYFVVKVSQTQQVVVATNSLSPGAILTADDLTVTQMDKSLL